MFTGIIEATGIVKSIRQEGTNLHYAIESTIAPELTIDQSVSHNGVCLTVTSISGSVYNVTAIEETLQKTTLGGFSAGTTINLERCMRSNGRFDGHIVQGHVDQIAWCASIEDENGSWRIGFEYDANAGNITVEKGSIAVDGVSLTCFNSRENSFSVAIIPYTWSHTNFHQLKKGDSVNLEFDIIGKYIKKIAGRQTL